MVTADENYVVTFHPELIQEWVTQFAQQYDTAGKTRQFTTPDGRAAEVSGGTYVGRLMKRQSMRHFLRMLKAEKQ